MHLGHFFSRHPIFTTNEVAKYLSTNRSANPVTRNSLLNYHEKRGRILRVRRGLYAVVPLGTDVSDAVVDPFLVTAKLTNDAVLAYHTALAFHGKAYSVHRRYEYLTSTAAQPLQFRSYEFYPVRFPKALESTQQTQFGVTTAERAGISIRVTGLERTLVDVLDRPALGGGWEEVWRSLESVEFFDLDQVIAYALLLNNATTVAKVGFYLEQHRETLMVEASHLARLREHRPKEPHYAEPKKRRGGKFVADWNLVVPEALIERTWEAVR